LFPALIPDRFLRFALPAQAGELEWGTCALVERFRVWAALVSSGCPFVVA